MPTWPSAVEEDEVAGLEVALGDVRQPRVLRGGVVRERHAELAVDVDRRGPSSRSRTGSRRPRRRARRGSARRAGPPGRRACSSAGWAGSWAAPVDPDCARLRGGGRRGSRLLRVDLVPDRRLQVVEVALLAIDARRARVPLRLGRGLVALDLPLLLLRAASLAARRPLWKWVIGAGGSCSTPVVRCSTCTWSTRSPIDRAAST